MTILNFYVTFLCSWRAGLLDAQAALPGVNLALELLAGQHLVPTLFVLASLVGWFAGSGKEHRAVRQQALLRAFLGAALAWVLAVLAGGAARAALEGLDWTSEAEVVQCWLGFPFPSVAAAVGFALGAVLWRTDWRWGLACLVAVAVWTAARVFRGLYYPLDVVAGAMIGTLPGWALGWAGWLERPLAAIVRFLQRIALA